MTRIPAALTASETDPRPIRADLGRSGLMIEEARLRRKLAALPADAPVVAMVHGWRYGPGLGGDCPHETILARDPLPGQPRVTSWPRALGLDGKQGLGIALGWQARCDIWRARSRAGRAGAALAEIAALLQRIAPERKLHVLAHSMGARVTLSALRLAPARHFGRVVLLAGAESRPAALTALACPGAAGAEIVNVSSHENDLFDAAFEWGVHLGCRTSIGQGLMRRGADTGPANWRDLWIDDPQSLAQLARQGFELDPPEGRICHWSPYMRRGALPLWRALLDGSLAIDALPRSRGARRWSRLIAPPGGRHGTGGSAGTGGALIAS